MGMRLLSWCNTPTATRGVAKHRGPPGTERCLGPVVSELSGAGLGVLTVTSVKSAVGGAGEPLILHKSESDSNNILCVAISTHDFQNPDVNEGRSSGRM